MHSLLPFTDLIQAFGWTILHSFWQGCCVFLSLRIVLWLWPQAGPSIKYHLSFLSLTGIAGWFGATFATQLGSIREASETMAAVNGGMSALPAHVPMAFASAPAPAEGLKAALPGMEAYFPLLVGIYVVGVTVMTIRLCIDLAQLKTLRRQGLTQLGAVWEEHLAALARKMGIGKKVGLFISRHLQVPVMIGFMKPVILLPTAMVNNLSPEQLEAILLHELAHIKRNDYLLNIFQSIVETILFFNPFVWWISRNIRLEREHCCDDLVLASTVQPMHYAKALVALEEFRLTVNPMAMAAAHDRQHLFHRIKRIMEMKTKHLNYSQRFLALLIIVTGLVSIAWLTPDSKRSKKEKKAETTAPAAPAAKPAIMAAPSPSPAPAAVSDICAGDTIVPDFITEPELPVPPVPPVPPSAPIPPVPASAPFYTAAPLPPVPPMPPAPPTPPLYATKGIVYDTRAGEVTFYSPGDTTVPGGRIKIIDKAGKVKTYNSIDDMSAEERKQFEESYIQLQDQHRNFKFNEDFQFDKHFDFKFDSSFRFNDADLRRMQASALKSLQDLDLSKLQGNLDALSDMKWENFDENVRKKLKKEDWEKVIRDTQKNLKKIDWKKQQQEINKAVEQLKKEELKYRKEAQKYRNDQTRFKAGQVQYQRDMARHQAEARAASDRALAEHHKIVRDQRFAAEAAVRVQQRAVRERERALFRAEEARELTEKNRATTRWYNDLLKAMESDKLIDRESGYNIEKKGEDLFINGKKQSDDIKNKYKQYLKNDNVTIKGDKTNLQIHARDNEN
ncbi:M56 family metallopeptidase [Chitinophaga rhizosphaerae]|uniref:M56 family metallopeptidase n=1 Tax=Chitinophaga rhizosphaerae TaxID=1864947 RepID=UPI000F813E7E|nr:M56 family metallopeptidase [Chitinophaga rhizosphaerae]